MIKIICTLLIFTYSTRMNAQSIDKERLLHAKKSVVRILIDNIPYGTGFIVSKTGQIITCWHVIQPAISVDATAKTFNLKKITAEFISGKKIELGIYTYLFNEGYRDALIYDYCYLEPTIKTNVEYEFLKLGNFENVNEGEQIYSVGYPLGIEQQFVSSGILSTKWTDKIKLQDNSEMKREVSWLDLTMNKGNSGGPVLKIGSMEDEVIGIATFILNPYANTSQELSKLSENLGMDVQFGGISQVKVNKLFADAVTYNSIGISGCVSIDHINSLIKNNTYR
jgi:serine protease Do